MRGHSEEEAAGRQASVLRWAEALFVIGGIAMLAWCAVVVTDAYISQRIARQSLDAISHVAAPAPPTLPASAAAQRPRAVVRRGVALAALTIPRVDLSAIVLHGSDEQTLRRGPGHVEGTAVPGEAGNVVIAGHRDSFFRPLRYVRPGDDLFLDTPHGRFQYRVTSLQVVHTRDLSVLAPTEEEVLTLITCYPFWLLGNAPDRFVVRATRIGDATAVTAGAPSTPPFVPSADPDVQQVAKPAGSEVAVAKGRTPPGDETLIREAIERFRLTYNARLISRNDHRPGGPLEFQTCDVIIDGDQATAHCRTASESAPEGDLRVWTSTLRRTDRTWSIKQITSAD
jgi:sortase A